MPADTKTHFFQPEKSGESFRAKKIKPDFVGRVLDIVDTLQCLRRPIPWRGMEAPRALILEFENGQLCNSALYSSKDDTGAKIPLEVDSQGGSDEEFSVIAVISRKLSDSEFSGVVHTIDPFLERITKYGGIYLFEERDENGKFAETENIRRQRVMAEFNLKEETITTVDDPNYWYVITGGNFNEKWAREPWRKKRIQSTYQPPLFREDGKKGKYVSLVDDPIGEGGTALVDDTQLPTLFDKFHRQIKREAFPNINMDTIEPIAFGGKDQELDEKVDIPWDDGVRISSKPPKPKFFNYAEQQRKLAEILGLKPGNGMSYSIREVGLTRIYGKKEIEYSVDENDGIQVHNRPVYLPVD